MQEGFQVWIDGVQVDPNRATVSVFDRGFLYGDSVFETVRTYGGRVFAIDEHLERLEQSARRVLIHLPVALGTLRDELYSAAASSRHPESYLRLMITRGVGTLGLDPSSATRPLRVIIVGPLVPPARSDYEKGIGVATFTSGRHTDTAEVAGAKIGNYLVAVLAAERARAIGAKESLIVDGAGRVAEGATSNFFWVEGAGPAAKLWTPPLEAGILAGITRAHVLRVAGELGLSCAYRVPHLTELKKADEVFVSSSIREILPVVRIDEEPIGVGAPGPVTLRLLDAFRHSVARLS